MMISLNLSISAQKYRIFAGRREISWSQDSFVYYIVTKYKAVATIAVQ